MSHHAPRRWEPPAELLQAVREVTLTNCDICGDVVDDYGCRHERRALCRADLHYCDTCVEAIKSSDVLAAIRLQPVRRPGMDLQPKDPQ